MGHQLLYLGKFTVFLLSFKLTLLGVEQEIEGRFALKIVGAHRTRDDRLRKRKADISPRQIGYQKFKGKK